MTTDTLRAILAAHKQAVHEAMSPWCNAKAAAAYLGVSERQIWKLKKAKTLHAYGVPGTDHVRFLRKDLDRVMHRWSSYKDADGKEHLECIDFTPMFQRALEQQQKPV